MPVYPHRSGMGNIEIFDSSDYWSGMVRFGKDQQRLHNVHRTALIEAVAGYPKAPFHR
ncbi:hypothetical protein [Xylella fastidiosa]|uniref:portal protein n=1 Tax=Xylella fastidiosa TaxID=2371 RepID=UPI003984E274